MQADNITATYKGISTAAKNIYTVRGGRIRLDIVPVVFSVLKSCRVLRLQHLH